MRLSLLLFISLCLVSNITNAQKIRLKSLQSGPSLNIQTNRQDTTLADVRKLVKDPQHFPKNSIDTLEKEGGRGMFYGSAGHVQLALLTTWEINNNKEAIWGLQKEWSIGVEYSYTSNNQERWSSIDSSFTVVDYRITDVYFRRNNHLIGLYTDFILKKGFSSNRISIYAGLGGSIAYSIAGNIVETKALREDYREVDVERYRHATEQRRDISVLFPMGVVFRPGNPRRPLGAALGIRPGFMIVKEKNLSAFVPGVLGFTVRLVYHLH